MPAKKKPAAKKPAAKKTTARKPAAAVPERKIKAIASKQTKTQILSSIAEETGLSRKDVSAVFSTLGDMITGHVKKRGSGEFSIPETGIKVRRVRKPATKSRMGRNPATGEEIKIAAKPARTVVKLTALKALKDKLEA